MTNVINWFEIPAIDFARAMKFYSDVLQVEMEEMPSPDGKMKYGNFPYKPDGSVVSGGIVKKEGFVPTTEGPIIYFNGGDDLDIPLSRVEGAGGRITMPKTPIEKMFMAEFIDTEGNRMRFHSMK
ncbi:VOC family protein [Maribellus maritimus]|uniref:VOC family protein n=1 Tax=Maribellus maritimus TaxID=2870838 RepID=UPI001EEBAB49|nr:VOC family protein [Maribellus maritimus]MCG6186298.1 VOC family protein [Maribellus maritimus]